MSLMMTSSFKDVLQRELKQEDKHIKTYTYEEVMHLLDETRTTQTSTTKNQELLSFIDENSNNIHEFIKHIKYTFINKGFGDLLEYTDIHALLLKHLTIEEIVLDQDDFEHSNDEDDYLY